jgi:hypothetical protein
LLELALGFGLVAVSAAFLVGVFMGGAYLLGPAGRAGGPVMIGVMGAAFWVLKHPWTALLRYYRYEAHTLRPLKEDETTTPGVRRDKNEG